MHVKTIIQTHIENSAESLKQMAARMEMSEGIHKEQWNLKTITYFDVKSGLRAIEWIDKNDHSKMIVLFEGDPPVNNLNIIYDEKQKHTLEVLSREMEKGSSPIVNLVEGGKGFLIYVPIFFKNQFQGVIVGAYDIREFLDGLLGNDILQQYSVSIYEGKDLLYTKSKVKTTGEKISPVEEEFPIYNNTWKVVLKPDVALRDLFDTYLPELSFFMGLILATATFFAFHNLKMLQLVNSDLTQSNKELLDARIKADQANIAKTRFLTNMSHELRTPLNGVIGMASLLAQTELNEKQAKNTQRIVDSGKMLMTIIDDILDFSKIEAGILKLYPIPADLKAIVKELVDLINVNAAKKNIEIITRYAPEVPTNLVFDPRCIRQIVKNLLNNATKFTPNGKVLINISCKEIKDNQATIHFEIQDNGVGIPLDKQNLLFEKFSQADTSSTRKFGGTGLGLAICKRLVELMRGNIGFTSEKGKGSTFWFEVSLPIIEEGLISSVENGDAMGRKENLTNKVCEYWLSSKSKICDYHLVFDQLSTNCFALRLTNLLMFLFCRVFLG